MDLVLILAFVAIVIIDLWAAGIVFFSQDVIGRFVAWYWLTAILVLVAAILMTSYFSYFPNPNTKFIGWPVPRIVFQRDTPTSPWLDFIGPMIVLAYPINFALYMFLPSLAFLRLRWRAREKAGSSAT